MKKGVFFTLTAVLILVILFSLIIMSGYESAEISEVNIQYRKHKLMVNYLENIEEVYFRIKVADVSKAGQKEVIKAIAEMTACCDSCCGGHWHKKQVLRSRLKAQNADLKRIRFLKIVPFDLSYEIKARNFHLIRNGKAYML